MNQGDAAPPRVERRRGHVRPAIDLHLPPIGAHGAGQDVHQGRDESGFRYMRNRYYDPLTGRFTQEDPSGLAGGLNLYGFAAGDPINFGDPFGLGPDDHCEEHGLQDWPEYIELPGPPPSKTPIVVTIWHDCSKERAAEHERRQRLAQQQTTWLQCMANSGTMLVAAGTAVVTAGARYGGRWLATQGGLAKVQGELLIDAFRAEGWSSGVLQQGAVMAENGRNAITAGEALSGTGALYVAGAFVGAYAVTASVMCALDPTYYDN
jgi:RHS repeat-associated protein